MSKNAKLEKKQGEKHNHKARQLMMQYVITLGVCIGSLALFVILSKLVLSVRVWYPSDSYWPLLHWLNLHIITVCAAIGGAIWLIVTIYYLYRVFRQIDEIVDAAGKMVSWPEKPLEMPRSLEGVQNELNLVREQALRNEMAAKEAEQKKNDLIVYLAHDLKTPLTSVIGYLSLLRDELQISEKLRERYTEIALNKAERLEELINEFFDITRFNLSVMTLEKETIHFSRMLEQIVSEFEPILQEKRLSVESVIEKDIILSGQFAVVELTKIFRQASQSDIVVNAHKINKGIPVTLDNKSMDFFFLKRYDANVIIRVLIALIQNKLPKFVNATPYEIQVLTPMRKGLLGVERLNMVLQQYLNPPDNQKREKEHRQGLFREGDKVMQIKNNYQTEWEIRGIGGIRIEKGVGVFNGDTGIIREINLFAETLTVEFEERRFVEYPFRQLDELELAYAITIHKSQGSEYPAVVIPLLNGPKMLMNRNLLYTAVTRARKCVTLVGDEKIFWEMEENQMEQSRYTTLDLRLKEIGLQQEF